MNNPWTVKLDLNSIMKCWFGFLFFFLVFCVQSYLPPFSYHLPLHFSLPLFKITTRMDRLQTQRNWQRPRIETHLSPHAHTLTSVWPSCFLRGQVCCTDYWQQNGVHVTVCLGLNSPALNSSKKRRKNKILRSTIKKQESNQHSFIESRLNMNIGLFILWLDYWINKQNHFAINEFISLLVTGTLDLLDCNCN